jgi:hypothetical protein
MQRGADPWQAAGYLGMSLEVLLNTYGHHHPDYLSDAVEKIAMRDRRGNEKRTYLVRPTSKKSRAGLHRLKPSR